MKHPAAMLAVGASLAARAALALPPDHGPFGPEEDRALYLPACEFARQVTGDKENHKPSIRMSKNRPSVAGKPPQLLGVVGQR